MFLYKKIKEARIEKNMTQKELADELTKKGRKTSNTAVANWEAGLNSPDVDTVQLICDILQKDGNYFFTTENNSNINKQNNVNIEGLDENDIEDLNVYADFLRNKKKK